MDTALYAAYALAHAVLLGWGLGGRRAGRPAEDRAGRATRDRASGRTGHGPGRASAPPWALALVHLVVLGLLYDNAVLAAGRFIGTGAALEALSHARYWAHALLTPMLVLFCWGVLVGAGVRVARRRWALLGACALTAALVAAEIGQQVWGMELEPQREHGVLSYTAVQPLAGPPVMVLGVSAVLLLTGAVLWWRRRWPWMFLAALAMTVGSAVPVPVPSAAVTNAFEVVLLAGLVATERWMRRRPGSVEPAFGAASP